MSEDGINRLTTEGHLRIKYLRIKYNNTIILITMIINQSRLDRTWHTVRDRVIRLIDLLST